jgi:hypothetical protein
MNNYNNRIFCVYGYKLNKVWIYIGNGIKSRPCSVNGRSERIRKLMKEKLLEIIIIKDNLTKIEAEKLEEYYLNKYYGKTTEKWKLENKQPRSKVKELSYEFCSKLWYYDPTSPSGLRWLVDRNGKVSIGDVAGSILPNKYYAVETNKIGYRAHRIVYVLNTKTDLSVDVVIDHIDSNPSNNKIENLQAVTRQKNSSKKSKHNNNTSGHTGVSWHAFSKSWRVSLTINYKMTIKHFYVIEFGSSDAALEAAVAYRKHLELTLR